MRSRIEDVAAAAGVSMKTVSRVLNNEPNVRDEMRQRVMKAVEQLQYRPNLSARSLAGQRSYVIALVYNNPSRNYLMEIQSGMLEACHAQHYNLILGPVGTGRRTLPDLAALFENSRPDGVVLIPPLSDDPVVLSYLQEHDIPFASIAPRDPTGAIGVRMDETTAVVELMRHLIALGEWSLEQQEAMDADEHRQVLQHLARTAGQAAPAGAGDDRHLAVEPELVVGEIGHGHASCLGKIGAPMPMVTVL